MEKLGGGGGGAEERNWHNRQGSWYYLSDSDLRCNRLDSDTCNRWPHLHRSLRSHRDCCHTRWCLWGQNSHISLEVYGHFFGLNTWVSKRLVAGLLSGWMDIKWHLWEIWIGRSSLKERVGAIVHQTNIKLFRGDVGGNLGEKRAEAYNGLFRGRRYHLDQKWTVRKYKRKFLKGS